LRNNSGSKTSRKKKKKKKKRKEEIGKSISTEDQDLQQLSPRGSSIGCEPRFMKHSSQDRIPHPLPLCGHVKKKKKKKSPAIFLKLSTNFFKNLNH
jgi:hypothetical protein